METLSESTSRIERRARLDDLPTIELIAETVATLLPLEQEPSRTEIRDTSARTYSIVSALLYARGYPADNTVDVVINWCPEHVLITVDNTDAAKVPYGKSGG